MGKKRSGGIARFKSKLAKGSSETEAPRDGPAPPAHIQRKVARKVQFLDKVAASKAKALAAKPALTKKKRKKALPSLDALQASLGDVLSNLEGSLQSKQQQRQLHQRVVSAKGRMHAGAREADRLKKVLNSQQFKANPIQAIAGHLNVTLPPPPTPPKGGEQGRKAKNAARRKKRNKNADADDMIEE